MTKYLIWISLLTVLLAIQAKAANEERPIVSLKDGLVQGVQKISYDGRKYSAFEGIPYAKPPVGNLRFKEPQPVQPWSGTLQATTTHTCLQYDLSKSMPGSEDCLYINVYVPRKQIDPNERLDVLVHIHGGAFMLGTPHELAGPSKLMDRDLVYVNFNYRLGPLGFLSFGDKTIPGNFGMKDQTFALLWVKNNIEKFGGNPNSVTINGGSAGGGSVDLHYFSPISKGLFHRGIAGNGVALTPWAIKKDPYAASKTLAKDLGCHFENTDEILRCMQQRPAVQIQETIEKQYINFETLLPLTLFAPVIEPASETAFLTTHPYKQFEDKTVADLPFMAIMTTDEGTVPGMFYLQKLDVLNENLKTYFPITYEYTLHNKEFQENTTAKIVEHYFNNEPITMDNYKKFIKLSSDRLFHIGGKNSVKLHASSSTSNAYFLLMGYGGAFIPGLSNLGVGHCLDMKFYYDFNTPMAGMPTKLTDEELVMKTKFLDMIVSFAKTGVPKIDGANFEPIPKDGKTFKYLYITNPNDLEMVENNSFADEEFWNSLGLNE